MTDEVEVATTTAPAGAVRCVLLLARGPDVLFRRALDVPAVPRVGDHVHTWIPEHGVVRGKARGVRWVLDQDGVVVVHVHVELSAADRERFAQRPRLADLG